MRSVARYLYFCLIHILRYLCDSILSLQTKVGDAALEDVQGGAAEIMGEDTQQRAEENNEDGCCS